VGRARARARARAWRGRARHRPRPRHKFKFSAAESRRTRGGCAGGAVRADGREGRARAPGVACVCPRALLLRVQAGAVAARRGAADARGASARQARGPGRNAQHSAGRPLRAHIGRASPAAALTLCPRPGVQGGGPACSEHGFGRPRRGFHLRSVQAKCVPGGADGQRRDGELGAARAAERGGASAGALLAAACLPGAEAPQW